MTSYFLVASITVESYAMPTSDSIKQPTPTPDQALDSAAAALGQTDYITVTQAAALLTVTRWAVLKRIHAGTLPAVKLAGGNRWMIRLADLISITSASAADAMRHRLAAEQRRARERLRQQVRRGRIQADKGRALGRVTDDTR